MPRNTQSKLMEEFIQKLDSMGMLKEAYPSMQAYKDDPDARVSSESIEDVEKKYNVKPDQVYKYEHTIMEAAHPKPVFLMNAYDKINGLVENNIERSNIMQNIIMQDENGNLINPKFAHQELTMELVRIANEMDVRNKSELFSLADECLIDLSQEIQSKYALAPLAVAALIAVPLAAGWLLSHTDDVDNGPKANAERAIEKLKDLKTNSWWESDVDESVQAQADLLISEIEKFQNALNKFSRMKNFVSSPKSIDDMKEIAKMKESAQKHGDMIEAAVAEFKSEVEKISPMLSQAIENFNDAAYQKEHSKPSSISQMTGWLGEALHGRWGLVANDFTSAAAALKPLQDSLTSTATNLGNFDAMADKYEAQVKSALEKQTEVKKPKSEVQKDDTEDDKKYRGLMNFINGE